MRAPQGRAGRSHVLGMNRRNPMRAKRASESPLATSRARRGTSRRGDRGLRTRSDQSHTVGTAPAFVASLTSEAEQRRTLWGFRTTRWVVFALDCRAFGRRARSETDNDRLDYRVSSE